ncbi:MAG: bacterial Ig-like domain-containing protein [Clostridia bacterium]|nr:bacterial Ig-like domain-containing protein [Clostridia bacterium]
MKNQIPKRFNQNNFGEGGGIKSIPKRTWIIIAIVAAVVIIASVVISIIVANVRDKKLEDEIEAAELHKLELREIQIARTPNKLVYYCGTPFDTTGLAVYSLTYGGKLTELDLDNCTITGFDSSVPVESQTITVTYKGFTATFTVQIKAQPTENPTLVSIKMATLPKTTYKLGERLDVEGGTFTCYYSDGTTKTVALEIKYTGGFVPAMNKGPGEHEMRVVYEENGIEVETTYKITITE